MARVLKKKRLINPGRRKRHLSLKQRLFFGSKRQRAAAKQSLGRSKAKHRKRTRVSSSPGKSSRRRRRVSNIGSIFEIGLGSLAGNPGRRRKKTTMARTKKSKARRTRTYYKKRRGNPYKAHRRRYYSHRARRRNYGYRARRGYRRNPGIFAGMGGGLLSLKNVTGVLGGLALTAIIANKLPFQNKFVKYLGTGITALVLGMLGGKIAKDRTFGNAMSLGGLSLLGVQILSDFAPGVAGYLPIKGMGLIGSGSYYVPQITGSKMNTYTVPPAVLAAMPAPAPLRGLGSPTAARVGRMR